MAGNPCSCAHCGRQGVALKRCMRCKEVSYCGAECQKAGWKAHKKTCEPPLPLEQVFGNLNAAHEADDWRGVLKLEGRMEELLEGQVDASRNSILGAFARANEFQLKSTGNREIAHSIIGLQERRVEILGTMERFRDQCEARCAIAENLLFLGEVPEAAAYYQRAREVGAQHGFFSAEAEACLGLGMIAKMELRHKEGVELLRNALAAAPLNEADDSRLELNALQRLIESLFQTNEIDELEPLVPRFREVAKVESRKLGRLCSAEFRIFYFSARLHEVLCSTFTLRGPCIPPRPIASVTGTHSHCPALAFTKADRI